MKKNELVHLHGLLVQVAEDYVDRGVVERDHFEPYRTLDVTPMALRESRDAHEAAVLTLSRLLSMATDEPVRPRGRNQLSA